MNSVKLYIELIQKALNGSLTSQEAEALKALDTLIETEDKLDEGVLDLDQYTWAFGPTVTEVLNSEAEEKEILKEELSQPAAEPLKHNPEEKKSNLKVKFAQNRKKSTLDRVMETISNK